MQPTPFRNARLGCQQQQWFGAWPNGDEKSFTASHYESHNQRTVPRPVRPFLEQFNEDDLLVTISWVQYPGDRRNLPPEGGPIVEILES